MIRRLSTGAVLAAGLLLVVSQPAAAGDARKETATAAAHAGMAAASGDLKTVRMHLHHVLNCLVGPGGRGFDPSQLDPCKGEGMGAIPDSPPARRAALERAAGMARAGLDDTELTAARARAGKVQAALKAAGM